MKTITVKNSLHLGDCIITLNLLNKIVKINDVRFIFNINQPYVNEINYHIEDHNKIILGTDINEGYETWMAKSDTFPERQQIGIYPFFFDFYNELCDKFKLESPISAKKDVYYDNINLLKCYNNTNVIKYNDLCYEHDYLLLNTPAYSGQFPTFSYKDFQILAKKLKDEGNKVITLADVGNDIPNTISYGMNLLEVGKVSLYSKNIIGVGTAPAVVCTNIYNYYRTYFKQLIPLKSFILLTNDYLNVPFIKTYDDMNKIE